MKMPWGLDWSLGGRRKSEGVEAGGWVWDAEGERWGVGRGSLDSTYDTATQLSGRYLTQAEQYARSLIYATILRSKAKISAARYRLVQSMAEEDESQNGGCYNETANHLKFDEEDVGEGWRLPSGFLKLPRRRSVKLGLKSFRRSFKQPLAGLILGGKRRKCNVEPCPSSPLLSTEEGFDSLCEEVLQKSYELLTPLEKAEIKAEGLLMPGQEVEMEIFGGSTPLEDVEMEPMQGTMSMKELSVENMEVEMPDDMDIGPPHEPMERGKQALGAVTRMATSAIDMEIGEFQIPLLPLQEVGSSTVDDEIGRSLSPLKITVKPPSSEECATALQSREVPSVTTISVINDKKDEAIPSTARLEPLSLLTLPRSPRRWRMPSFDDPTPVLEPEILSSDIIESKAGVEAGWSPQSAILTPELDENDNIKVCPPKYGVVTCGNNESGDSSEEDRDKKKVLEENLKNITLDEKSLIRVDVPLKLYTEIGKGMSHSVGLIKVESRLPHVKEISRHRKKRNSAARSSFKNFESSPKKLKRDSAVDVSVVAPIKLQLSSEKKLNIESGLISLLDIPHKPPQISVSFNKYKAETPTKPSIHLLSTFPPGKLSATGEMGGRYLPPLLAPPTKRRKEEGCRISVRQARMVVTMQEVFESPIKQARVIATLQEACRNPIGQTGVVATLQKAYKSPMGQTGIVVSLPKACKSPVKQTGLVATMKKAYMAPLGQTGVVATMQKVYKRSMRRTGVVATLQKAYKRPIGQARVVATIPKDFRGTLGHTGVMATMQKFCGSSVGQTRVMATMQEACGSLVGQTGMVTTLDEACRSPMGQDSLIVARQHHRHLDAFEFYRAEDEREWARRYEEVHVDTKSASAMFKLLQAKLQYSAAYPHFLSLLHHLLLLPSEVGLAAPDSWILYDRVVQQLVTQRPDGEDREVPLLDINVAEIVKLIANERELTESRRKISKLEADFADVVTDLNSKEQQLYAVSQEKEDLTQTLGQVRTQLEAEVRSGQETGQRVVQLEARVEGLSTQLREVAKGCVSDDLKASIAKDAADCPKGAPPPPPPPMMNGIPPPPPMMNGAPPPPPPMMNGVPPPPPPMGGPPPPPMMNGGPPPPPQVKQGRPAKQVPRSANQLRAFNWAKMPDGRVGGTIFATLDESPLYKFMDLEDIDRTFDASVNRKTGGEGEKTLERMKSQRMHQISFLENRRQQNCTILLSKLKMTNEELVKVLLKMDSDGELAPDMVEQLLKFTPTVEEKVMLEEHQDELETLARADRFLLQISKIEHYEERLRCLLYQKKYRERLGECEPRMSAVSTATRELTNSKRLKKFIEIVLAFGNYMNKGARGGAYGFRMSSLNKLTDTKASSNRSITLLHYILRVCEKQWRDVLRLEEEFPSLKEAAKVNITELEKEMCGLREGLSFIEREVAWHRGQGSPPPGDRFRLAMNEFSALARDKFTNLEAQFTLMKSQFEGISKLFGEDSKTSQPEDFFGSFDSFIESFREAKRDLENMRKKEEEEERKKKEAERREVERERRAKERSSRQQAGGAGGPGGGAGGAGGSGGGDSSSGGENENDFDDLISALRSGDVFGKDIDKMRRKKKQSFSGARESTRERVTGSHKYA